VTATATKTNYGDLLGKEAEALLSHECKTIPASSIHAPGPDFIDRVWAASDRPIPVLRSLQSLYGTGRLANTGFLSILPVDQGIEHTAGASFAPNPMYFDPENIVKLAIEGGCNAVASTYGVLGALFMPFLAITLLVLLNKRRDGALPHTEVPARWRNGWLSNSLLALCALLFVALSINELVNRVKPLLPGAG